MAFVNIGILHKGIGTVSDEFGNFTLKLEDQYAEDSLKISLLGYKFICFKVKEVRLKYGDTKSDLYLDESNFALREVVIRPKKYKTSRVGNEKYGSPCVVFIGDTSKVNTNAEVGTLIKIKQRPTFIDNIKFGICENDYDSIRLRLNIYNRNNDNILQQPIYVTIKRGEKVVTINTKPFNIKVDDDFIIAFEALQILQTKSSKGKSLAKFSFSGGFSGSDMLMRTNIYDKWEKVPVVVIGFNANITYEDTGNWFKNLFK